MQQPEISIHPLIGRLPCNREISFGISFESINVSQNYILPDCIQIAYEMHWQNGLDY